MRARIRAFDPVDVRLPQGLLVGVELEGRAIAARTVLKALVPKDEVGARVGARAFVARIPVVGHEVEARERVGTGGGDWCGGTGHANRATVRALHTQANSACRKSGITAFASTLKILNTHDTKGKVDNSNAMRGTDDSVGASLSLADA